MPYGKPWVSVSSLKAYKYKEEAIEDKTSIAYCFKNQININAISKGEGR
jgi:hypothetical protein